jgi:protein-tyrosine-phosphatase
MRPPFTPLKEWMMERPVSSVLFACTSNSIRSRLAEELARWRTRGRVHITSCGVNPGDRDGFVAEVLDEIGLELSDQETRGFRDLEDSDFDLIITLSPDAHEAALEFARNLATVVEYWPTVDPSLVQGNREQRLEAYRRTRDEIQQRITARVSGSSAPVV